MRILIIQLRRIGDILLTTPVISYLRQVIPEAEIDFLAEPMGTAVLETYPHLSKFLKYDRDRPLDQIRRIRGRGYTAVLDFMNNPRSTLLTALSGARWRVGFKTGHRALLYNVAPPVPVDPEYVPLRKLRMTQWFLRTAGLPAPQPQSIRPQLHLTPDDRVFADTWMAKEGLTRGQFAVLAPAHRHPIRAWRSDGFRSTALDLKKRGLRPYLAWGPGEEGVMADVRRGHEGEIGLLPLTTLRQMAAIFEPAAVVVTNDSGAMHLAVSVGTPTVTVYGPTRPIDWNPSLAQVGSRDAALTAEGVPCLGCHLHDCPVGHICMTKLPAARVIEACEAVLGKK